MRTRQELYNAGWTEHEVSGYFAGLQDAARHCETVTTRGIGLCPSPEVLACRDEFLSEICAREIRECADAAVSPDAERPTTSSVSGTKTNREIEICYCAHCACPCASCSLCGESSTASEGEKA